MEDGRRDHTHGASNPAIPTHADDPILEWVQAIISASLPTRLAISAFLLGLVAALDVLTGSEVSFSIFYLLPVASAGVLLSRRAGRMMAVISAGVWGFIEVYTGRGYSAEWIPYWNSAVRLGFFLLVNELMYRLWRAHTRVLELSRTDSLTGISNGRVFEEHAHRVIKESRRNGRAFTLAYLDLDRFKLVNDKVGHREGDRLLRAVATLVNASLRATDVAARLGGDEFGILMPETDAEQARVSLERIAAAVASELGHRWAVGATFGAVTFIKAPEDVDFAVRQADALMYQGKAGGRGQILQATWPGSAASSDPG